MPLQTVLRVLGFTKRRAFTMGGQADPLPSRAAASLSPLDACIALPLVLVQAHLALHR